MTDSEGPDGNPKDSHIVGNAEKSMELTGMENVHHIQIGYPKSWKHPSPPPARYDESEHAMTSWLDSHGVMTDSNYREILKKTEVARNCAYSYPSASTYRVTTAARFLGLWFAFDDPAEGVGVGGQEIQAGRALAGSLDAAHCSDSPVMQAWCDLGQEFRTSMSPQWCQRFGDHFETWMYSVEDEAALSTDARRGHPPTTDEYLAVRANSVGADNFIDLIEYALQRELAVEVFSDPYFQEIWQLTRILIAIDNDLHGITKDANENWLNLVFSCAHERNISWAQSCGEISRFRASTLSRLLLVEERIRRRKGIEWWLDGLHHMISGLADWTHDTPRYSSTHHLNDGTLLHVDFNYTPAPPPCQTAMRPIGLLICRGEQGQDFEPWRAGEQHVDHARGNR
ncbi:terpene synthase family protein [Streptomyces olivoreticuli]